MATVSLDRPGRPTCVLTPLPPPLSQPRSLSWPNPAPRMSLSHMSGPFLVHARLQSSSSDPWISSAS
eukprot:8460278-Pyramimonas_sp.AAC.1